jgi:WD40 repeat protein
VVLKGHASTTEVLEWSPDGALLATGNKDKTVRLWEARTGCLRAALTGHAGPITRIAWSPNGQRLASLGSPVDTNDLRWQLGHPKALFWDTRTGERLSSAGLPAYSVTAFSWSPDGERFVLSGKLDASDTAKPETVLWDTAAWRRIATLPGHPDEAWQLEWSPDGKTLATAGLGSAYDSLSPQFAFLWNGVTGQRRTRLEGQATAINRIVWNRSGRLLLTFSEDAVVLRAGTTGQVRTILEDAAELEGWSADEKFLLGKTQNGGLGFWDGRTGQLRLTLYLFENGKEWLAVAPDGRFTGSPGGTPHLFWEKDGKPVPLEKYRAQLERPSLIREVLGTVE